MDSNGNVSGTLAVASVSATVSGACIPAGTKVSFTGMLTSQGRLTLTSAAISGQTISLAVTVSSDGNFFSNGSFTVTGGCLNGDHGTLTVNHLVIGSFAGSFMLNGNTVNMTVNFTPGIPQLDGSIPLLAGATFGNNSACGFSTAGAEGGDQTGLAIDFIMMSNSASIVTFGGSSADSSATMVSGTVGVVGGTCDQMKGTVTLKKS